MQETNHVGNGGVVEYLAVIALAGQMLAARFWLMKRRANWARMRYVSAFLIVMWLVAALAVSLSWSGAIYYRPGIPLSIRTSLVAVGYFWMLLSTLAAILGMAGRFLAQKIPGEYSPARRNWLRAAWVVAVAAPAAAVGYGSLVERHDYGVDELDLPVPGLHPDLEGFRIVQVSDLHVSPFLSPRQAARAIDMANELRADLAVFTGDLISEPGDPLNDAIRELIRLRGGSGVFGCMGNHEQYVGCRNYLERQTRPAGMIFLRGRNAQIRRGEALLNIAGVDYQRKRKSEDYLSGAERLVVPGATNLLLSHNPDVFPTAIRRGFQTVLSGHTHGGQINVEILHQNINPARFRTPYISGLYRLGSPGELVSDASRHNATAGSCYVTNGIGTIGMPIRLGAPPQIALLRLRRA